MITFWKEDYTRATGGSADAGRSFTRTMFFKHGSDDNIVDLIISNRIPEYNDCHPVYTWFCAEEIGEVEVFDDETWSIDITYTARSGNAEPETDPWDLPPQDVTLSSFDQEVAMNEYWNDRTNSWSPFVNSAGTKMLATKIDSLMQLTFTINRKTAQHNSSAIINNSSETVCGIQISRHCGKLLPFTSEYHKVTNPDGSIKYEYVSQKVTIHINPSQAGFRFSFLNVGTLSFDGNGNLSAHYKYRLMRQKSDNPLTVPVAYGTIDQLIAQRQIYVRNGGDVKDFPYEEFTEPLPLTANGELDQGAIAAGANANYSKIEGFHTRPGGWNRYDLPRSI